MSPTSLRSQFRLFAPRRSGRLFKVVCVTAIGLAALALVLNHHALAEDLSHADKSFINSAAEAGLTEINASKIALAKTSNQDVKDFATMMVDDHTTMADNLKKLAASKNVVPPTEPGMMQKAKIAILEKMDGAMFDKQYASMIGVSAHEDAVGLFSKTAREARDPDVKDFAAKSLSKLQRHLEMATSLKTRLDAQK